MSILDTIGDRLGKSFGSSPNPSTVAKSLEVPLESLGNAPYGAQIATLRNAMSRMDAGTGSDIDRLLTDTLARGASQNMGQIWKGDTQLKTAVGENISGYIGINDYGFKGKRQYIADRRYLLDLYVVAYNNADIRTAITHQRNEVFRRGMEWTPKWDFRCPVDGKEYSATEAKRNKGKCQHEREVHGEKKHIEVELETPDERQKVEFDKFMDTCNYFGQSLETVLREIWDDINVVDDAFIFVSKEYFAHIDDNDEIQLTAQPKYIFRLDPVLVEFDLDQRGIPGMRHHVCLIHRDELLEVPPGEGWEIEWKGVCPQDKLPTYPVIYKYNESYLQGGYGSAQSKVLYLTADEVIHFSYYTPSELYGYPPILSIYEKALTLIGMDRYLYDYFYERRVPQGMISTVTDDPKGVENMKAEVQARMMQDPHYIPWVVVSAKTGAGKTEFVRFAYSLDELNYLPVRDEIRERIAGIYGVSNLWMSSSQGVGGMNSEQQQLIVMSRVVEGAQRVFHEQVFPSLMSHFGITDWLLELQKPEEQSEMVEIEIKTAKATWAMTMAQMGFGVEYDQEEDIYTITGRVLSMEDQNKAQMAMQGAGGMGQPGDFGQGGAVGTPEHEGE